MADDKCIERALPEIRPPDSQAWACGSFENDPLVTLEVGPGKSLFHVHKGLLCQVSPVFDAAFNGAFKENCGSMRLSDDNPAVFEYLVQWLYRRKVLASAVAKKQIMVRYSNHVELYLLADKYGIVLLKNHVMRSLFDHMKKHQGAGVNWGVPDINIISHAYALTTENSRLRRFLVASWTCGLSLSMYGSSVLPETLLVSPEFAADLAIALAGRARGGIEGDLFMADVSPFLESTDGKPQGE
ncbi:MAG: hypothetical protein LQ345_001008 [Seirophora villosa]|nr:MAG: hypothetical protein LQ345_001008 [Seirophora villosa]